MPLVPSTWTSMKSRRRSNSAGHRLLQSRTHTHTHTLASKLSPYCSHKSFIILGIVQSRVCIRWNNRNKVTNAEDAMPEVWHRYTLNLAYVEQYALAPAPMISRQSGGPNPPSQQSGQLGSHGYACQGHQPTEYEQPPLQVAGKIHQHLLDLNTKPCTRYPTG